MEIKLTIGKDMMVLEAISKSGTYRAFMPSTMYGVIVDLFRLFHYERDRLRGEQHVIPEFAVEEWWIAK